MSGKVVMAMMIDVPEKNRFFTGQMDKIHELAMLFTDNQLGAKKAISGLSGIGKTELALEYCYLYKDNYEIILWANAQNVIKLSSSYLSFGSQLGLLQTDGSQFGLLQAEPDDVKQLIPPVRGWLNTNSKWLLVLDDVDVEQVKSLKVFLPNQHQGHILITTQATTLGDFADCVNLYEMDIDIGATFLLRRGKYIGLNDTLDKAKLEDKTVAKEIAQKMYGLPLAIDQAAAYIDESQCSLAEYLNLYEDVVRGVELRNARGENTREHISVSATFKLAFGKIEQRSLVAAQLLRTCALLSSDLIPEEIFTQTGDFLGKELTKLKSNSFELNKEITLLLKYSLVKRDANNKNFSIHGLLQQVILDLVNDDNKEQLAKSLIKAVNCLFPDRIEEDLSTWPQCQRLLPTTHVLFKLAKNYAFEFEEVIRLFYQAGTYCNQQALYSESLLFCNISLDVCKKLHGADHLDVAGNLNNIAVIYRKQGKDKEALEGYQKALTIKKKVLGARHPVVAKTLTNIAVIHRLRGKHKEALDLYREALFIYEHWVGDNQLSIALTLNNIANVYTDQGKYEKALEKHQKALVIRERKLGANHPDTMQSLGNMAKIYATQARYEEALENYQKVFAIQEKILGAKHPDIAETLKGIASIYSDQGKYKEALENYQKAFAIKEEKLGIDHPDLVDLLDGIAIIYDYQGKYEEALENFKKVLIVKENTLAPDSPAVAGALNSIAIIYSKQGKYEEALENYQKAFSILEKIVGTEHPDVAQILNNIGNVYREQKEYEEALENYQKALSVREEKLGINHPDVAQTLGNIAGVYAAQGNFKKANELYQRTLKIYQETVGNRHPNTVDILEDLTNLWVKFSRNIDERHLYLEEFLVFAEQIHVRNKRNAQVNSLAPSMEKQAELIDDIPAYTKDESRILQTERKIMETIKAADVKGTIDFGIITIRDDEHRAILARFPEVAIIKGERTYRFSEVELDGSNDKYRIAIVRVFNEGGEGEAQNTSQAMINDLDPSWLLLVGIAGGVVSDDFTLGDVLIANRVVDLCIGAESLSGVSFDIRGGPMHPIIQDYIYNLAAIEERFKSWNTKEAINQEQPSVDVSDGHFYEDAGKKGGFDEKYKKKIRETLLRHFGDPPFFRLPKFTVATNASSDRLIKDPRIIKLWQTSVRKFGSVEMELGGIYIGARKMKKEYPILAIRGISDVVGFDRDNAWTKYACSTAASLAYFLIKFTRPIEPNQTNADLGGVAQTVRLPREFSVEERLKLINRLTNLLESHFELFLRVIKLPPGIISSSTAQQGRRVSDLIAWAEPEIGLVRLQEILDTFMLSVS